MSRAKQIPLTSRAFLTHEESKRVEKLERARDVADAAKRALSQQIERLAARGRQRFQDGGQEAGEASMTVGKGTSAGKELSGIISEIEAVGDRKKQIGDQEKEIFASSKAKGYDPKTIRRILTARSQDTKQRETAEALFDSYMHAIGMADELPLFRSVGMMGVDVTVAEQVVEAPSQLVPIAGEIIVKVGAARIRLYRDTDGNPHAEEAIESKPLDPRYSAREGAPAPEGDSSFPASPRARGLSKEAIARIVERAEASAKEKVTEASAHEKRLRDADAIDAKRAKAAEPASA